MGSSATPVPAWRSTVFVSVRVTFHGSVSPNAHGRVAPVSSPAAPARRVSRSPCLPESCCATSATRSAELTHRLRGESPLPVGATVKDPWSINARSSSASVCASTAASLRVDGPAYPGRRPHGRACVALPTAPRKSCSSSAMSAWPACPRPIPIGLSRRTATSRSNPRPGVRLQVAVQPVERIHQRRRAKSLLRQRIQLGTLVGRQAVCGTAGQPRRAGPTSPEARRRCAGSPGRTRRAVHEVIEILLRVLSF